MFIIIKNLATDLLRHCNLYFLTISEFFGEEAEQARKTSKKSAENPSKESSKKSVQNPNNESSKNSARKPSK